MRHVQACFSGIKEKAVFTTCGGPVKVVQACLCVGSTILRCFHSRGGAVKHLQAC